MQYLNSLDNTVIVVYFAILVGVGFYLKKRAAASLDDYYLGGRSLPWWALGISGMASFLDMTGTMIIVSFLYMLGPRGLYIEFRGGAVLVLIFYLLWMGKWHRRSGCMTGAEWMIYRFGEGFGGQFARLAMVLATVVTTIGMLAYLVKGVGLFLAMFLPYSPFVCSLVMITVATIYTAASGFYGVVYTDFLQSIVILVAVFTISVMAMTKVVDQGTLAALAHEVTGSSDWTSSALHWKTTMPEGYEAYRHLLMFAFFYVVRNILTGVSTGDDPKYFGARSDRECGLLTNLWTWLMMFRWPMMMGFAILGLFLVRDLFPDQTVLVRSAALIKEHFPGAEKARWGDIIAEIVSNPSAQPAALMAGLQELMGSDWSSKLQLLSFEGTVNPERIVPAVLLFNIPMGLRGLLLVALIAASMSTFDSTVNRAAGYLVRDVYQRYLRPSADTRELILTSYAFSVFMVILGFALGYTVESINDIWGWIIMGLGGGLAIPFLLRFYWWRFNGGGFAIGTMVGLIAAVTQRALWPRMVEWQQYLILTFIGLAGAIIGTYLTKPTEPEILENFYKTTRPFGFWGPLKAKLAPEMRESMAREFRNDLLAVPFIMGWQITLFLLPMQAIIRAWNAFGLTFIVFVVCLIGKHFFWYRNLPPASEGNR